MIEHASTASCHVPTPIDLDVEKESGTTKSASVPPSILSDDLRRSLKKSQKENRKKFLTKRAFKGYCVLSGYAALYWRGGSLVEGN